MKSMVNRLVFLALVTVGLPLYAANFTVDANLYSLDLVVDKSPDGRVHVIKNFDEAYFNYSENINGNTIRLVSDAQIDINGNNGRITYPKNKQNLVMNDRARVTVQTPDDTIIKFVSVNGGITVNDIDCASIDVQTINGNFTLNKANCDSIQLDMSNGEIYYTGGEEKNIHLETVNGDIYYTGGIEGKNIHLETVNGDIYYTGGIEGKNIHLETVNGDINIGLEAGTEVDVDIQSSYSYRQHPPSARISGTEKTGYNTRRINNKRGSGLINAVTRHGSISCKVLY